MTKEERLQNFKDIINAVFRAENDVLKVEDVKDGKGWQQILQETKGADSKTKSGIADEYVEAIAKQIIDNGYLKFEGDKF